MTIVSNLIDYFLNRRIAGLEYYVNDNEEELFSVSLVKQSRNGMKLISSFRDITKEELSKHLPTSIPVVLGISGKFILSKIVENLNNEADDVLLNRVIPNALLKDFYLQKTLLSDGLISLSISRRDFIDSIIEKLAKFEISIVHVVMGVDHVPLFLKAVNYSTDISVIKIPGYSITFMNDSVSQVLLSSDESNLTVLSFNDKNVGALNLFSFALSFVNYFSHELSQARIRTVFESRRDYKYSAGIRKGIALFSLGLITILLINQLVFYFQNNKSSEMKSKIIANENSLNEYNEVKKKYGEKEHLFTSSGLTIASYTSIFIDQLSEKIPSSIVLSAINVQPFKIDKTQDQDRVYFESKKIIVEGFCSRTPELSEWINIIKKNSWVKDVLLNNINNDPEINNNRFSLDISIK